ncbi:hypothetical protein Glove_65g52 [Diversispora epigaea]|uniref:C2H2-type domain-containing protein n=1 Tax=Diversispora epigaea TaxID=1348612 RepID=A0A397JBT1_9GLOM|nr:hypothetical protein Glove_65g52 [Diversispora epigaea]
MSWKCDFCPQRIFITKTSYTNHIKRCLESVDSSEELSLEVMMIDSLESENLLNNENNFESIHENSNEDEDEDEDDDDDDDSNNAEAEEESLTSNISHSSVLFFENMELSNSDAENYLFNNYALDNNNICEEAEPIEFPNNAYADLMALVTNYNLSNEATNAMIHFFNEHSNLPLSPLPKNAKKGCELMEKMKIPTLTSKKHKILTHNNIDYYLFYHPVLNCIKNILSISDISQNFTLRFENFKYKGEKAYSEQYTGNWWKNTEASLPDGSKLLSIILYSDATTTDTLDRMHHLNLGLFQYQIKFTQALLQKQDSSLVGKIDDRLSKIPRFQKFQMFTNGLQLIFRITAKEYRILMKVMVFVVDNLYEENKNNVEDFVENRKLSEVYAKWNKMYNEQIRNIHRKRSRKFSETYESLHKDFVKIPYRMSNKKNVEDQIMKTLKRQDIINVINKKQKKKKSTKLLNFSSKLFETKLTEAYIYFCEKINDPNINDNMIKENRSIIRAKNKFHDKPWFSNVAISMDSNESSDYQSDEGLCYGKILLMAKIEIKEKSPLNLALVQWYNFKFQKIPISIIVLF